MKKIITIILLSSTLSFPASEDYCIDQYNHTQQSMHKTIANNNAKRNFYARIDANLFQDLLINLRIKCSKTNNKTIRSFLKDSKKIEKAMVDLELLKSVSY